MTMVIWSKVKDMCYLIAFHELFEIHKFYDEKPNDLYIIRVLIHYFLRNTPYYITLLFGKF